MAQQPLNTRPSNLKLSNSQQFLNDASILLASSLDYQTTLSRVAQLAVPQIADWCTVHIVQEDGTVQQLAVAHSDPTKVEWAYEFQRRYPPNPNETTGLYNVIRTGKAEFYRDISDEMLVAAAKTDQELLEILRNIHYTSLMIIPLNARGKTLGAIQLVSAESGRRYEQADLDLADQLAQRAAIAIDNSRLFAEAQRAREMAERLATRTSRLQSVTAHLSRLLEPVEVAKAVVDQCLSVLDHAYSGMVALLKGGEWLELIYSNGYSQASMDHWSRMPMSNLALPIVFSVHQSQPLFLKSKEDWLAISPTYPDLMSSASLALLPLIIDGQAIGGIVISFSQPQSFDEADCAFMLALAQQCAQAIERARLYQAEQQARLSAEVAQQQLSFLARASDAFASSIDYETTLKTIAVMAVPVIADWCTVDMLDSDGNLREVAVYHTDPEKVSAVKRLRSTYTPDDPRPNPPRIVAQTGKSFLIPEIHWEDIESSGSVPDQETADLLRSLQMKSLLYVPIKSMGRTLGVISLTTNESGRIYGETDTKLAEELARRAGTAIENSLLYKEVREQRERLQTTLTSIGDALIATDENACITFLNPVAETLTGWTQAEAVGRNVQDVFRIINESTRQTVESPVSKVLREGVIVGLANHTILLAKDGREIPIDDSGAPIRDEHGNTNGVILVFRDITERHRLEAEKDTLTQQLQRAAQRAVHLQEVTSAFSSALVPADVANILVGTARETVGAVAGTLVGLADDTTVEIIQSVHYDPSVEDSWQRFPITISTPLGEAIRTGTPVWVESTDEWKANYTAIPVTSLQYAAWASIPLIVKGRILGGVGLSFSEPHHFSPEEKDFIIALAAQCAQALDRAMLYEAQQVARIETEKAKQRIEFLSKASELLAGSLDYDATINSLRNLILSSFADIYTIDLVEEDLSLRRELVAASTPELEALLRDLAVHYIPDPKARILSSVLQSGKSMFVPKVDAAVHEAAAQDAAHLDLIQKIGVTSQMAVPLRVRDTTIGVLSLARINIDHLFDQDDLTLVEALAHRVAQAIDNVRLYVETRQAVRLRDEFLSVAAHELKTPVTSMRGFAQTLLRQIAKRGEVDLDRLDKALHFIDDQSSKLTTLIGHLLDISRIESGRLTLDIADHDVVALLNTVVNTMQQKTQQHTIIVTAPPTLTLSVDALRLEQVLVNLLDNAIKYAPDGGPIQVSMSSNGGEGNGREGIVTISVRDFGLGIPPERRNYIFDRFYQAHREGYLGGMGLGLYISRQIIELHGGNIVVEFPGDKGTCFIINLPMGSLSC